jgi:hypothetical protein
MVPGDICEPTPNPVARVGLAGREAALEIPNGLADVWPGPLGFAGDESDEASDWTALNAVDAAPRAIMSNSRTSQNAAHTFPPIHQRTTCITKANDVPRQKAW